MKKLELNHLIKSDKEYETYQCYDCSDGSGVSDELVLKVEDGEDALDLVVDFTGSSGAPSGSSVLGHDDQVVPKPVDRRLLA